MSQPGSVTARRAWLGLGLAALLLLAGREAIRYRRRAAEESLQNLDRLGREPAPHMELLAADGSSRRLADARGRPVLVHFWATWCPPCRRELPGLLELGRRLRQSGEIELVAISVDDDWAAVRKFFGGEIPREVVMDARDAASETWQLSLLPETYLLDREGRMRLRFVGPRDWGDEGAARLLLEEAAAGAPAP